MEALEEIGRLLIENLSYIVPALGVFARLGALFYLLPAIGETVVPVRIRLTIAMAVSTIHRTEYNNLDASYDGGRHIARDDGRPH